MRDVSSPIQPCHRLDYEDNNRRTKKRTLFSFLEDVNFADYVAVLSHMQEKTSTFKDIRQKLGLKINQKKSMVMGLNQRNPVSVYV